MYRPQFSAYQQRPVATYAPKAFGDHFTKPRYHPTPSGHNLALARRLGHVQPLCGACDTLPVSVHAAG